MDQGPANVDVLRTLMVPGVMLCAIEILLGHCAIIENFCNLGTHEAPRLMAVAEQQVAL